jgi:hypothetical protein
LRDLIHYANAEGIITKEKVKNEQERYLTLQNGLFDLEEEKLIDYLLNPNPI